MELIEEYILKSKSDRMVHVNLDQKCIERGGNSHQCRGLLAHILDTTIPKGMKIHLCHACNNALCSNPAHLYWGTAKENQDDSGIREKGTQATKAKGPWNKGLRLRKINRTGAPELP